MNAHAASHDELADMGIPQPQRLDPLCGAAALATCLPRFLTGTMC